MRRLATQLISYLLRPLHIHISAYTVYLTSISTFSHPCFLFSSSPRVLRVNVQKNKIHFLFCNNTSKPPVFFMYSHYVPLIIFFSKNPKNKPIPKHKLPSHSTNGLKPKKPCGQFSMRAFYKGLPEKWGKLNMITSTIANKYAFVRRFGSISVSGLSYFFFWKI